MTYKKLLNLAIAGVVSVFFSVPASAQSVFQFNHTVGAASAQGTITTDGSLGLLTTADILDWNIFLDTPGTDFLLLGPASGNNSQVQVGPAGQLFATTSLLTFNFSDVPGNWFLFQNPFVGSSMNYLCFAGQICGNFASAITVGTDVFGTFQSAVSDTRNRQVIATLVPEPEVYAMLVAGLGLMGFVARRRKQQLASA